MMVPRKVCALCCVLFSAFSNAVQFSTPALNGDIPAQTWKVRRDAQVVKQNEDFSCGAASLATLLNGYYGQSLTESQILKDMNKPDMMANFEDMARVVNGYGFKAGGVALGYEQLAKLTVPVVVYLQVKGNDHFSVLRGISPTHVQLADPSMGNRIFTKAQFQEMWETRNDALLKGKILLILPQQGNVTRNTDFFVSPSPSVLPLRTLVNRSSN
jgi:predicted double-glycine peptidase